MPIILGATRLPTFLICENLSNKLVRHGQRRSIVVKLVENLQILPKNFKTYHKLDLITYCRCLYLLQDVFLRKILLGIHKTRRKYPKVAINADLVNHRFHLDWLQATRESTARLPIRKFCNLAFNIKQWINTKIILIFLNL